MSDYGGTNKKRGRDRGCEAIGIAAGRHHFPAANCYQAEPNHIQRGAKVSGYIYPPALVAKFNQAS